MTGYYGPFIVVNPEGLDIALGTILSIASPYHPAARILRKASLDEAIQSSREMGHSEADIAQDVLGLQHATFYEVLID